jgi:FkbM family methyltransferase
LTHQHGGVRKPPIRDRLKVALTAQPRLYDAARRPYALARYALRRPHDPDYAAFALFPDLAGLFLDVGANSGMSAYSFRIARRHDPILSIEPNPFHARDLRFVSRFAQPFEFRICAAGREHGTMLLHIPTFKGVPLTTEASLIREQVESSPSLRERLGPRMDTSDFVLHSVEVPIIPLDALRLAPAFVKLDVQGFELAALEGLHDTLRTHRPPVMLECPGSPEVSFLAQFGYEPFTYDGESRRLRPGLDGAVNAIFRA